MQAKTYSILDALAQTLRDLREKRGQLREVKVAVIDSGIDATHERCAGRICNGALNNDPAGHGTAVAGIIAALAPNATLMDIRVLDEQGAATGEALVEGLTAAVESDAQIINMSLVCNRRFSGDLMGLCEKAYRKGQVVIAAKRNVPLTDDLGFPAEISSCIGVESSRTTDPLKVFFTGNAPIEFAACGESVLAPRSGGGYIRLSGTSFATPIITAAVTLFKGAFPELRPFEIKTLLKDLAQRSAPAKEPAEANPLLGCMAQPYPGNGLPLGYRTFRCKRCRAVLQCAEPFSTAECPFCHTVCEL